METFGNAEVNGGYTADVKSSRLSRSRSGGGHLWVGAAACSHELVGITGLFDDVSVVL